MIAPRRHLGCIAQCALTVLLLQQLLHMSSNRGLIARALNDGQPSCQCPCPSEGNGCIVVAICQCLDMLRVDRHVSRQRWGLLLLNLVVLCLDHIPPTSGAATTGNDGKPKGSPSPKIVAMIPISQGSFGPRRALLGRSCSKMAWLCLAASSGLYFRGGDLGGLGGKPCSDPSSSMLRPPVSQISHNWFLPECKLAFQS